MRLVSFLIAALLAPALSAQTVDVAFRHIPVGAVDAAFVPAAFNSWGQPYNGSGCIQPGHESQMEFVRFENYWLLRVPLTVGTTWEYKIQVHFNTTATDCQWLTDPLNPDFTGPNSNSVITIADPMVFQLAEELTNEGFVRFMSASLVSSSDITSIDYTVNGVTRTDGLSYYDADRGVFRYELDRDVRSGSQLHIRATDAGGRMMEAQIGEIRPPVDWITETHRTVEETATLRALVVRFDGTVDPALTGGTLRREGGGETFMPISDGVGEAVVSLDHGDNVFTLEVEIDSQVLESDPITLTNWTHPLDAALVSATVSGAGLGFAISLQDLGALPGDHEIVWDVDEVLSTTEVPSFTGSGLDASGIAASPGEVYVDVTVLSGGETVDALRVAVLLLEDGSVRDMAYEENAAWIKSAVVYEIFALQFGSRASGTFSSPGNRLQEITDELDYIAGMGFNTIWFMPIMRNLSGMTPVGAGYNIIDFERVDERLGTNEDFRALVERAHELGIRIILDLTPSHVSPDHPWTESLRTGGAYADYIQTTPSSHGRGQDGRGANLPEIWQVENGEALYRKYEGFGDLANLNWDNDNLQAEMLDVIEYWLREYDIDGYRMDVWWGPVRRYGASRFARPVRDVVKRIKPDAWLLGEITGTGVSSEVYYADDDFGSAVVGGLDAGYDWQLYHNALRGAYGNIATYDNLSRNNDFHPGPNARYFRFLENHDEPRLAWLHRSNPDRMRPLAGFLLTINGVPMVYAGQEVGFGAAHDYAQRDAVDWELEGNDELAGLYQRLAHARTTFPAFWTQRQEPVHVARFSLPDVYAFTRPYLDQNALIAINFEADAVTLTLDPSDAIEMSHDGPVPYYDVFADTSAAYLGEFTVTLPPYSTTIWITEDNPDFELPTLPPLPYGAVYTGTEVAELPGEAALLAGYPNPFRDRTQVVFELAAPGRARLTVFDLLGRRVASLADGFREAGRHEFTFDGSRLPSGTYLVRLEAGGRSHTRSMVLVR